MDNFVLQDLQDYYAQMYGLMICICDGEGNYVTRISGSNVAANQLLCQYKNATELIEHVRNHADQYQKPFIYEIIPGVKSIIVVFHTCNGPHFIWAGGFTESNTRDLVTSYFQHHVEYAAKWSQALEQIPEMSQDSITGALRRIEHLKSVCTSILDSTLQELRISQEMDRLHRVRKIQKSSSVVGSTTCEVLNDILEISEHIQFVGYAEKIVTGRYQVLIMAGEGANNLVGCTFSIGEGFLGHTVATGVSGYWKNTNHDPRAALFIRSGYHPETVFAYPIRTGNEISGVFFGTSLREIDSVTMCMIDVAAESFSVHLKYKQLLDNYQVHDSQLAVLTELSYAIISVQEMKSILLILLDMSINLVQGPFSCLVFRRENLESVDVFSRGISTEKATLYGRELAQMYLSSESFEHHSQAACLRTVWDVPVIECKINHNDKVIGVLAVGLPDESQSDHITSMLMILTIIASAGLHRIYNKLQDSYDETVTTCFHESMAFWNKAEYDCSEEASKLAAGFARKLGCTKESIKYLAAAAKLEPYGPASNLKSLLPDESVITKILHLYYSLDECPKVQEEDASYQSAQILAVVFHYLRGRTHLSGRVSDEMEQKFSEFILLKDAITQELNMVEKLHDVIPTERFAQLTSRENEVLNLLVQGFGNREIAQTLFISEHTVKNHLTNIFQKLNVSDRTQAIAAVYQSRR